MKEWLTVAANEVLDICLHDYTLYESPRVFHNINIQKTDPGSSHVRGTSTQHRIAIGSHSAPSSLTDTTPSYPAPLPGIYAIKIVFNSLDL